MMPLDASQTTPARAGSAGRPWALVTGASAGLGESFARELARRGFNLVLVARRGDRLAVLETELVREFPDLATRAVALDLSTSGAVARLSASVDDIEIDRLVCNAGAAMTAPLLAQPGAALMANFDLNARVVLELCRGFGAAMVERGRGGIIVVSSIVGFTAVPGWALYSASKAFAATLALALAEELRATGVMVQALCPGHIRTEFHARAGIRALWPMRPDEVARQSLAMLGRRQVFVPGLFNRFCVFGLRLLPRRLGARVYGWVLAGLRRGAA